MRTMNFLNLFLLSQRERRGLKLSFPDTTIVMRSKNGYGKSAVSKSLYDTFGASPHKIDAEWRGAGVTSVVEFSVDDARYFMMKAGDNYSVFDQEKKSLISTSSVTSELSPFLSNLLDFKLVMRDKRDEVIVPPPAYIFAPYYVDQDQGWVQPWSSFKGMYLNDGKRTLFDYHLGIRPNSYYEARAERDRLSEELNRLGLSRSALSESLEQIRDLAPDLVLNLSLEGFERDSEQLVFQSSYLYREQLSFLQKLSELNDEKLLWAEQKNILEAGLREMDDSFATAMDLPDQVECPTCGQHYDNSILEQFDLIKDKDDVMRAILTASQKMHDVQESIDDHRKKIGAIRQAIEKIQQILTVKRAEVSLGDVISAQGRNEAVRLLLSRLDDIDRRIGKLSNDVDLAKAKMEGAVNRRRSKEIMDFYVNRMQGYSRLLDVRIPDERSLRRSTVQISRGSEGPRGLSAYYYACLAAINNFGSSCFCPIVIDAPNQQGQDREHLPALMNFLVNEKPKGRQLIIASEELFGIDEEVVTVIDVGIAKNQVLDQDMYEEVSEVIRPLLGQLL